MFPVAQPVALSLLGVKLHATHAPNKEGDPASSAMCSRAAAPACIPSHFALTKLSLFALFSILSASNSLISLSSAASTEFMGRFLCLKTG